MPIKKETKAKILYYIAYMGLIGAIGYLVVSLWIIDKVPKGC